MKNFIYSIGAMFIFVAGISFQAQAGPGYTCHCYDGSSKVYSDAGAFECGHTCSGFCEEKGSDIKVCRELSPEAKEKAIKEGSDQEPLPRA